MNRWEFIKASTFLGCSTAVLGADSISCSKRTQTKPADTGTQPKNYRISTASGAVKIMPEDILPESDTVTFGIAGNETECFQIVIRPETTVERVSVTVNDLVSGSNRISGHTWHQVGYVYISTFAGHPVPADVSGKLSGWYPDPLLTRDHAHLIENWSNSIWVTVHAPAGTPAGTYQGTVELEIGPHTETIHIEATVYGFSIPAVPSLPSLFSLALEYLAKVYPGLPTAIRKNWLDFLAERRIMPTDLYIDLQGPDGAYRITPEEYVHYNGQTNGFVIYPITVTWEDRNAPAEVLIQRFEENRRYIDAIIASGAAAGGKGVFYGFDENEPEHFDTMKAVHAHIKSRYPDIPIATTSMHIQSLAQLEAVHVDILVLHITDGIYNNPFADQLRAAGKKVWGYISLQPYHPMPNWRIENALIETRVLLSAMAYHERFDGFLYWGVNQYNKGQWETPRPISRNTPLKLDMSITTPTEEYKWLHGDGLLIYPGTDGPLSSIRMENIRKGLEEYEYYKLVEAKLGKNATLELAAQVAQSMSAYTRDVQEYLKHKASLAAKLG
ncbi:hypothetical protein GCM10011386_45760 [Parapedobacter defluvii]|uniref:Glycoside hydrolase 123 C-terminal domain-containing protein n=1 Tax=Parapedobacter defluvii TaxID=2045106 RepID=A0ABQ1MWJ5_9SPHI|nr:DUF4091 domain-containing protein [Parapedobacter defluvii]GGC48390.1 hypothetical protein GCM10011386_45760 [Parapedobacter defluvii]